MEQHVLRCLAQQHRHNRSGRDLCNSPGHILSLPGFELTILMLAVRILNPQANRTPREGLAEKNKLDHKNSETGEIMHPRRER